MVLAPSLGSPGVGVDDLVNSPEKLVAAKMDFVVANNGIASGAGMDRRGWAIISLLGLQQAGRHQKTRARQLRIKVTKVELPPADLRLL